MLEEGAVPLLPMELALSALQRRYLMSFVATVSLESLLLLLKKQH